MGDNFIGLTLVKRPVPFEVFQGHTFLDPNETFEEDCVFLCTRGDARQVDLEF